MKNYYDFNKEEFNRWISSNGDNTLRLDYDLNENSIVLDAGGFKGEWSQKIYDKYNCYIFIFEPVKEFFDLISEKFKDNDKVSVFNYGLSNENSSIEINVSNDASSVYDENPGKKELISLVNFSDFISNNKIKNIDLFKINIEGGEYDLMPSVISHAKNIKDIQVQFHRFIPNCEQKRNEIRESLIKTHITTYDFEFIWENWRLKYIENV